MTEDEFQAVVRYPDYNRQQILLHLVAALARPDAVTELVECLARFAGLYGWRLAELSADGPAGDEAALRGAIDALVGELGRWRREPYPTDDRELRAREFALVRTAWRAMMATLAARGIGYEAQLAATAARAGKGVGPLAMRWVPSPVLPLDEDPPFTMQFGAHTLTMQAMTVTLDGASATFDEVDVAMLAFEVIALAFEREGLVGTAAVPATVPGTLGPIVQVDDRSTLTFQNDALVDAAIYDGDSASFYDCSVWRAERSAQTLGAFSPAAHFPPGARAIHLLRRLFAHPAAAGAYPLHLQLAYGIDFTLDWLAARPEAARLSALTLWISRDYDGPKYVKPRPLGAEFPNLKRFETGYCVWLSHFSSAAFPALEQLTLTHIHDWAGLTPRIDPPLADVAADIGAKVPKLYSLTIS
ncbi:MAG TPA: hypothetical protein VGM88_30930 [Kofleriaceae bacterium]|jgi:hypothetical protein